MAMSCQNTLSSGSGSSIIQSMTRNNYRTSLALRPRSYKPGTIRSFQACRPAGLPCVCREVQQLHGRKADAGLAAEQAVAKLARPPGRVVVGQHGEARHWPIVPVEDAVVVGVHAARELRVARRLHFDVDQHPALDAVL